MDERQEMERDAATVPEAGGREAGEAQGAGQAAQPPGCGGPPWGSFPPYGTYPPYGAYPPPCPPVPAGGPAAEPSPRRRVERQPFSATRADGFFSIIYFLLGFMFTRWLVPFTGWGVTAFTLAYVATVLSYALAKGIHPPRASWWWLGITLLCGGSYALWPARELGPYQGLLLVGAACWWCCSLFGMQMAGKTGNRLVLDAVNLLFITPFRNYDTQVLGLAALGGRRQREGRGRRLLGVLAGLGACLLVLLVVLPMLTRADSANFGTLLGALGAFFAHGAFWRQAWTVAWQLALGLPVAWYICGMVAGGAHRRYARNIPKPETDRLFAGARVAPQSALFIVLGVLAVVYVVFLALQMRYFSAAFSGIKPDAYPLYSEYAREGFFELCRVAGINLGLVALANTLTRRPTAQNPLLKALNILLSLLTLLVLATAFAKMALYITMHGYTPKRVITCVFMVFLAGVCGVVVLRQFRAFSVVRVAAVLGSGLLCVLCLCNLDGAVARLNADRWLDGRLGEYNLLIVQRGGPAGAAAALEVYHTLEDGEDRALLAYVLDGLDAQAHATKGTGRDSIASALQRGQGFAPDPDEVAEGRELFYNKQRAGWDGTIKRAADRG